jgi:hypothetical protein
MEWTYDKIIEDPVAYITQAPNFHGDPDYAWRMDYNHGDRKAPEITLVHGGENYLKLFDYFNTLSDASRKCLHRTVENVLKRHLIRLVHVPDRSIWSLIKPEVGTDYTFGSFGVIEVLFPGIIMVTRRDYLLYYIACEEDYPKHIHHMQEYKELSLSTKTIAQENTPAKIKYREEMNKLLQNLVGQHIRAQIGRNKWGWTSRVMQARWNPSDPDITRNKCRNKIRVDFFQGRPIEFEIDQDAVPSYMEHVVVQDVGVLVAVKDIMAITNKDAPAAKTWPLLMRLKEHPLGERYLAPIIVEYAYGKPHIISEEERREIRQETGEPCTKRRRIDTN